MKITMNNFNIKTIGAGILIMSTMMGGGILSVPILFFSSGFFSSTMFLLFLCLVAIYVGLVISELSCILLKYNNGNFITLMNATIGIFGKTVFYISLLCLLYSLLAAFILAGGSITRTIMLNKLGINLNMLYSSILFATPLCIIIYNGINFINRVVNIIFIFVLFLIIFSIIIMVYNGNILNVYYFDSIKRHNIITIPIYLTLMGFHTNIPSISAFLKYNIKKIKYVIFFGPLISCIIYIMWGMSFFLIVPNSQTILLLGEKYMNNNMLIGSFLNEIYLINKNLSFLNYIISIFSSTIIVSSFLSVSMGLFDFVFDYIKNKIDISLISKIFTAIISFFPPLIIALLFPSIFIMLLKFASVIAPIILIIIPMHILIKSKDRLKKDNKPLLSFIFSSYPKKMQNFLKSPWLIYMIYSFGFFLAILAFYSIYF